MTSWAPSSKVITSHDCILHRKLFRDEVNFDVTNLILTALKAENFIRFCFCRWLQNHTRTTFFLRSSFFAMAAILSEDGRG